MPDFSQLNIALPDIEFLRKKSLLGDLIIVNGTRTGTIGEICSYTPATGKTFFLYAAKITRNALGGASINTARAQLKNDITIVDYFETIDVATGGAWLSESSIIKGDKLVGNGAKKYLLDLTVLSTVTVVVKGTIIGWIENT
jgi:hypothetical protein